VALGPQLADEVEEVVAEWDTEEGAEDRSTVDRGESVIVESVGWDHDDYFKVSKC